MGTFQRDPISEWFDSPARRLAERAYAARGDWAGVYLAPPTPGQRARLAELGIDSWLERDRWGEARWVRGLKRSLYHVVNWYGGTRGLLDAPHVGAGTAGWHAPVRPEWETGARILKPGWPSRRWAIRVRLHPSSVATSRAGLDQPFRHRWIDDDGHPTRRQSTVADHTWEGGS
jgi:hypothetical protein